MENQQRNIIEQYSKGEISIKKVIDALGFNDYGDVLIALSQENLPIPSFVRTQEEFDRISAILQPLLSKNAN